MGGKVDLFHSRGRGGKRNTFTAIKRGETITEQQAQRGKRLIPVGKEEETEREGLSRIGGDGFVKKNQRKFLQKAS